MRDEKTSNKRKKVEKNTIEFYRVKLNLSISAVDKIKTLNLAMSNIIKLQNLENYKRELFSTKTVKINKTYTIDKIAYDKLKYLVFITGLTKSQVIEQLIEGIKDGF